MRLLVLNGPNLNMLGIREPELYGTQSYQALEELIQETCETLDIDVEIFQSNHEGDLVDEIQNAWHRKDAIIINPAAYTHTSVAILDALRAVGLPAVEVHLTDIQEREGFRRVSYAGMACERTIAGEGFQGYVRAIHYLRDRLSGSISEM